MSWFRTMNDRPVVPPDRSNAAYVSRLLGMSIYALQDEIRRRRADGQPWQDIADDLNEQAGVNISRFSYARWAPDPDGWTRTLRRPPRPNNVDWHGQRQLASLAKRMRHLARRYPHIHIADDLNELAGRVEQFAPVTPDPSQATGAVGPTSLPSTGGAGTLEMADA